MHPITSLAAMSVISLLCLTAAGTPALPAEPPPETMRPAAANPVPDVRTRRGYVDGRFGQIHYRIAEPRTPQGKRALIAFHLSPYSGAIYDTILPVLGRDRIAVAPDTPGFGLSDPPGSRPTIADYAAAMGDLMDGLGITEADLLGYHTGSEIAVELALQRPRAVHRLVMIAAPLFTEAELPQRRALYGPKPFDAGGAQIAAWFKSSMQWSMPGRTPDMLASVFGDRLRHPDIAWWGHAAVYDYPLAERLPRVVAPILLLCPDDDLKPFTPRARPLLNAGSVYRELPGWSHGFLDLKTEETATMLRAFYDAR
jgi:pimeloyl-ACP methyl ester carboxylesterase